MALSDEVYKTITTKMQETIDVALENGQIKQEDLPLLSAILETVSSNENIHTNMGMLRLLRALIDHFDVFWPIWDEYSNTLLHTAITDEEITAQDIWNAQYPSQE